MPHLSIDKQGFASIARQIASPNCDSRPADAAISLAVVHGISLPPGEFGGSAIEALFSNTLDPSAHPYFAQIAHLRVSAHFVIHRNGELVQFVSCLQRAWHAGASIWRGQERCNDFSIGIELEGADDIAYTDAQYRVLVRLLRALRQRFAIAEVVGHSAIAPGRKADPGPAFNWGRIHVALRWTARRD